MSSTAPSPRRYWMLIGWLTIFLVGTDLFVVAPFLPSIAGEMQVSASSLTWMVSVFGVTYAIASPLQGRLAERMGLTKVLLGGVAMLATGNLLTAIAGGVPSLLASRALAGLGAASTSPMLYALTAEHAAPNRRAVDLAIIGSGLLIALVMGAPVGLLMGGFSGWREVFGGLAIAFAFALPINWTTWRAVARRAVRQPAVSPRAIEPLSAALPFLAAMVCWASSVYAIYTLLGTTLEADYRLAVPGVAGCLAAFGVGATSGSILGGRLADRIGAARMTMLSFVAMTAAEIVMALVNRTHSPQALAAALFIFALCAYGFFPALQACAAQSFSARRPTVLALISSSIYVGITLGAAAGGRMYPVAGMSGVIGLALMPSFAGIWITRRIHARFSASAIALRRIT